MEFNGYMDIICTSLDPPLELFDDASRAFFRPNTNENGKHLDYLMSLTEWDSFVSYTTGV